MSGFAGFTLIELVVVIAIVGLVAAVALPRFTSMTTEARLARVKAMAGQLRAVAASTRAACMVTAGCSIRNSISSITIEGTSISVNYGYPDSGDSVGANQIDVLVDTTGWLVTTPSVAQTRFAVAGAPDPTTCSVTYSDAYYGAGNITITAATSGC